MGHIFSGSTVASQCKKSLINATFVITPFPLCEPSLPLHLHPKRMTWQAPLGTDWLPNSRGSKKKLHSTLNQYCCAHVWQCLPILTTLTVKPTDAPFKGILSSPAAELVQCHLVAFLNHLILGKKHVWILQTDVKMEFAVLQSCWALRRNTKMCMNRKTTRTDASSVSHLWGRLVSNRFHLLPSDSSPASTQTDVAFHFIQQYHSNQEQPQGFRQQLKVEAQGSQYPSQTSRLLALPTPCTNDLCCSMALCSCQL